MTNYEEIHQNLLKENLFVPLNIIERISKDIQQHNKMNVYKSQFHRDLSELKIGDAKSTIWSIPATELEMLSARLSVGKLGR